MYDADESLPHRLLELQPGVVPPHDFDAPQDRGLVVVERERLPNPRGQRDLAVLVRQRFPDRFVVERRVDPALRLCVVELTLLICLGQVRLLQGVPPVERSTLFVRGDSPNRRAVVSRQASPCVNAVGLARKSEQRLPPERTQCAGG